MAAKYKTEITLGVLTLVGVIATAVFGNWGKLTGSGKGKEEPAKNIDKPVQQTAFQGIAGNNNIQVSGSNNIISPAPLPTPPKPCRHKSHGVESYGRTFDVEQSSEWMGGGFDQEKWCSRVIDGLRGQHPEGMFEVLSRSERSESKCPPFNCPQYMYSCTVRVKTDPIYIEKVSSACP